VNAAQRLIVLLGLGGVVTTAWGTELILARITSAPQIPADALQSLLGLSLVAAVFGLPALLIGSKPLRGCVLALAALAPVLLLMGGILGPALRERNGFVSAAALVSVGIVSVWRVFEAWRGGDPFGRVFPWLAVSAAAFGAWASRSQSMPPLTLLAGFVALGAVLVVLPRLSGGLAIAVLYGLCVGLWPSNSPGVAWARESNVAAGPDIVLVTIGSLRADDALAMQSYQRIAAEGVRFTRSQAASSWTLPSMATLMTGRPEAGAGSGVEFSGRLAGVADFETLAERLARAGYDTAAVVADDPYVGRELGFDRGFAVFDSALDAGRYALPTGTRDPTVGRPMVARWIARPGPALSYAGSLAGRALHVVRRRRDRPLFLWVHFLDPHTPYRFAGELESVKALPEELGWDLRVLAGRGLIRRHAVLRSAEGRKVLRAAYRNEIARVDGAIGAILDGLATARHRRDRVVVLTSTHGTAFFEHGDFEEGQDFFQEVVHVPLVVSGLAGQRSEELGGEESSVVGHVDLAPTLLAASGTPDADLPGRDLARALEPRMLISQGLLDGEDDAYAVRDGDWKLMVDRSGKPHLYSLSTDPGEREDVAAQHPDVVARLSAAPRASALAAGAEVVADDATARALRSLGHLESGPD